MKKPNLIYIQSDQHTFDFMGCAGNDIVDTPNLDKLANSGTIITNAYAASPICVPSRMSAITGLNPSENEVWTNAEIGTKKSSSRDYSSYEKGRYSFNEDELKDIVTNSVQNALEKSIASSLVELAVSEIKNNVSGRV